MGRITNNDDFLDRISTSYSGDSAEEVSAKVLATLTSVMIDISKSLAWIADSMTSLEHTMDVFKETVAETFNKEEEHT